MESDTDENTQIVYFEKKYGEGAIPEVKTSSVKPWTDCFVLITAMKKGQMITLEQCNCKDTDLPPVKMQYLLNFHFNSLENALYTELGKLKLEVKRISQSDKCLSIELNSHTEEKLMNEVIFFLNDEENKINYYQSFPASRITDPELRLKEYIDKGELAVYRDEDKVYVVGIVENSKEVTEKLKKRLPSTGKDYDFKQDIQFDSMLNLQLLLVFGFVDVLKMRYPDVKVEVNEEQRVMSIMGDVTTDVTGAVEDAGKFTRSLKVRDIELEPLLIQLLKLPPIKTFILELCNVQNVQVVWTLSEPYCQITCYCKDEITIDIFHDILKQNFTESTFPVRASGEKKCNFSSSTTFTDFIDKHADRDMVSKVDGNNIHLYTTRDTESELISLEVKFKKSSEGVQKTNQDNLLQKQRAVQENLPSEYVAVNLPIEKPESIKPQNYQEVQKLLILKKFNFRAQLEKLIPSIKVEINDNEMKFVGCSRKTMTDEISNFYGRLPYKTVTDIPDSALIFYHTSKIGKDAIHSSLCNKKIHCHWYVDYDDKALNIYTQDKEVLADTEKEIKNIITWCEYLNDEKMRRILESQEMKSFFKEKTDLVQLFDLECKDILVVGLTDEVKEFENAVKTSKKVVSQASIDHMFSQPNFVKRKLGIDKDELDYLTKVKASKWNEFLNYYKVKVFEDPETAEIIICGNDEKQVNEAVIDFKSKTSLSKKMWSCKVNCPKDIHDKLSPETVQLHEKKFQCSVSLRTDTSLVQQQQLGQWVNWRRKPPIHYVLVHGNVYEMPADVLVCPTNQNFNPSSLASIMLNKGGSIMKEDFSQKRISQGQDIYISSETGNLPCLMVAYLVIPEYKHGITMHNDVVRCLQQLFEAVEKAQLQSLVIPVKILDHIEESTFIHWFVKACVEYESHLNVLTEIYLCTTDVYKIDGVMDVLSSGLHTCYSYRFQHLFENPQITSCGKGNERPADITISLIKGSLVDQKVDAIVNTSNTKLELQKGAVSSSILKAGGKSISDECAKKYPNGINFGQVVCTNAGKMNFKVICHSALPYWIPNAKFSSKVSELKGVKGAKITSPIFSSETTLPNETKLGINVPLDDDMKVCNFAADPNIKMATTADLSLTLDPMGKAEKFVFDCLQGAEKKNCKSIAFPVVGTGQLEYPWDEVAKTMIDTINKYGRIHVKTGLKEVKIVLYGKDEKSIKAFETRKKQTEEIKLVEEDPAPPPTLILESRCKNMRVQVIPLSETKFHHCEAVVHLLNYGQAYRYNQDNPKSSLNAEGISQMKHKDSDFWTVHIFSEEVEKSYKEAIQKILQFAVKERIATLAFCLMEKVAGDQVLEYKKQATIIRDAMNSQKNRYLQKVKIIIPDREKFDLMLSETITRQEEESRTWLSKVGDYMFNLNKNLWKSVSYLDFVESPRLLISVVGEDKTKIAGLKDNLQSMVEDVIKKGGQFMGAAITHDTGKRTQDHPPRWVRAYGSKKQYLSSEVCKQLDEAIKLNKSNVEIREKDDVFVYNFDTSSYYIIGKGHVSGCFKAEDQA